MAAAAAAGRWGGMGGGSGVDGSSHLLPRPPGTVRAIEAVSTAQLFLSAFPQPYLMGEKLSFVRAAGKP